MNDKIQSLTENNCFSLFQRRNEMQKKKLELNPPKTVEQIKFETQWKAGGDQKDSQAAAALVPQPSTSKPVSNPPSSFDAIQIPDPYSSNLFSSSVGNSQTQLSDDSAFQGNSFEDIQNFGSDGASFETKTFSSSYSDINFSQTGIPGLSNYSYDDTPHQAVAIPSDEDEDEEMNLDYEDSLLNVNDGPPPVPSCKPLNARPMTDIRELLDQPGRLKRPEK